MRLNPVGMKVSHVKNTVPLLFHHSNYPPKRSFSDIRPLDSKTKHAFGIAFDVDGVVLQGQTPVGGSLRALKRLYESSGALKVPFLFLTNGGGVPESRRAAELSELLGINVLPAQVMQGHTPFRNLLKRYENELIVATGKGEPARVMSEYGFKKALSLDEYTSYFKGIDPVAQYKVWTRQPVLDAANHTASTCSLSSEKVKAAFIVSDPVDWGRDIQVLCDILRSGGLPGNTDEYQPPLFFAADDLEYQAAFPSQRLGMGAFRIALESIFNRIHHKPLEYTCFGKPNPFVFKNAEETLMQLQGDEAIRLSRFKSLYMVGDNPHVDVKGARQAGRPWFSILTRTGVFRGNHNHAEFPADLVVDSVEEAVDFILEKERFR